MRLRPTGPRTGTRRRRPPRLPARSRARRCGSCVAPWRCSRAAILCEVCKTRPWFGSFAMSPSSGAELLRQVKSRIDEVDPSEVNELIDEGVTIIDVRGSEEFATGHLPGAKSIPRGHLESRIEG